MSLLRKFLPGFIVNRYFAIQKRLNDLEVATRCLEMAVDALVVHPKYTAADDVGFNGQLHRKRIFTDLISAVPVQAIAETGTWLGNTTAYMAQTGKVPVYSCEVSPRFHALAKIRVADVKNIELQLLDSRRFLQQIAAGPLAQRFLFFYLDAHWYDDLPLSEELDIIAAAWKQFIIMIDDFQVPDDAGYGYDNYGPGKALTIEMLQPAIKQHKLVVFFPSATAVQDTGNRRGCVVLARQGEIADKLANLSSLHLWRA
jgi:hypothetical protein